MPSVSERLNDSGQTMHHLRRVGPPATKAGVVDIMDFRKVTSIIGRNGNVVDFYLDSSDNVQCHLLSRQHARVVRLQDNQHKLFDDSLNGVFVNHVKISGAVILSEGDLVTFGHMMGNKLAVGIRVRQPDSEYQFIFERCNCPEPVEEMNTKKKFAVPKSPRSAKKKREQNATRTVTPEELKNMKVKTSLLQAVEPCSSSDVVVPQVSSSSTVQSGASQSTEVTDTKIPATVTSTDVTVPISSSQTSILQSETSQSAKVPENAVSADMTSVNSAPSTLQSTTSQNTERPETAVSADLTVPQSSAAETSTPQSASSQSTKVPEASISKDVTVPHFSETSGTSQSTKMPEPMVCQSSSATSELSVAETSDTNSRFENSEPLVSESLSAKTWLSSAKPEIHVSTDMSSDREGSENSTELLTKVENNSPQIAVPMNIDTLETLSNDDSLPSESELIPSEPSESEQIPSDQMENRRQTLISSENTSESACGQSSCLETERVNNVIDHRNTTVSSTNSGVRVPSDSQHAEVGNGSVTDSHNKDEQNIISYNGQFVSFDIKDQVTNRSCTEGSEREQQNEQLKIAEGGTNTGNEKFLSEAENVQTVDIQIEMECSRLSIERISEKMEGEDGSINDVQLVNDGARSTGNEKFSMSIKVDRESRFRSGDVSNACTIISDGTVESSNNQEVVTKAGEPRQESLNRSVLSTVSKVRGEEQLLGCSDREAGCSGQEMDTDDDELLLAYNASEMEMEAESEGSHHVIPQNTCATGRQTEISMVSESANALAEKSVQSASVDVDTHGTHEMEVVDVLENVKQNSPASDKTELELDNQANSKAQSVNQSSENMLEDGAVTTVTPIEGDGSKEESVVISQTEKLEDNPLELSKGVEEGLESRLREGEDRGPTVREEVGLETTNKTQTVCVNQEQVDEVNNAGYQSESSVSVSMACKSDKSYCEHADTVNQTSSSTMSSSIVSGSSDVNNSTAKHDTTKMFDSNHLEMIDVLNSSAVNETRIFDSKELDSSALSGELISDKSAENQNCLEKTMDNLSSSIDMDKFEKSHESSAFQFAEVEINMEEDRNDNFTLDKTLCAENVKSKMEEVKSLENLNDLHSTHLIEGDTIVTMEKDTGPKFEDGESVISKDIEISGNVMDRNDETIQKVKLDETTSMEELKLEETPSIEENVEVLHKTARSTFMLSDSVDFGLQDGVIDDEENLSEEEGDNVETNLPTELLETAAVISDTKQKEEVPNSLDKNEIDVIYSKQQENAKLSENDIVVMDTNQQEEESSEKEVIVIETDEQDEDAHSSENEVIVIETNGQNDNAKSSETEVVVLETKQEETDLSSENEVIVIDSDELEDDVCSLEKEDVVMETKQEATESSPSDVVIETKQEVSESSENEVVVFEAIQKEEAESNLVNENVVMETKQLEDEAEPSSVKVVAVMESNIQDVVTPTDDCTDSKEPIDSESETSQNPKIESRSSIIGLSQQYAELEHVMEMNRDVGSCMDSILDRVDSECNNESNSSSETNEDRLTNSNDKLVELPTNTLIEIEVSMESAKNLGLILKGENETSQSPNDGKPSLDQDQFVNVSPQCVISTTEVEKMEHCHKEENTETVVEKQFTIEDLVRLESKMQSDKKDCSENEQSIQLVATEQPKVPQGDEESTKDEIICEAVQEDFSDIEDTSMSKCVMEIDAADQLKSETSNSQPEKSEKIDSQPEEFKVYIDNHEAKEGSSRDILETMKILNSPVFVDEDTGASAREEELKHTKIEEAESTNVMEVADIGASNVESTTVEEVADIHDIGALNDEGTSVEEVADLGASNDKSNTVEEVADIGALNDEGTSVEEVADIGALNDEGTSVEEVADIGALNDERTTVEEVADIGVSHDEVQIPSPEERENVVTVMLSDNDDEDEAVDDIELLELQTQKTDSDDQYGYSLEDIFNSESRQSLQGKDGCDDGNNEKDEDDNGMKDDNVDDENQMKDDISEEFSDQNECEEDLVSESQLDNRDQAESGLELPALDVTSPKSPSASQAMSPVIPSFVKATHSLEDESTNDLPDSKTRPMKDDDADSESAMDSHAEDISQKDAKNGIGNTEFYQSSGEIPKVYIDRAESIDRSPRTVNDRVPGRNDGQKGEEDNANSAVEVIKDRVVEDKITEDKDAEDQVNASFDDEDDFVSPVIDFTALRSDDESGLDNPANYESLRKGTPKRATDSDSDNDFDVDDYACHESPSTAGVKATNVDTPKGARDSINSDDDFEPIPSTSFKKRKLFEESESPAKKPCREVVTLDVEMSTQVVQDISNTQFEATTEQLAEGQGQSPTKKSRARMLIERLKAKRLKGQKEKSPEREPSSGLSQETPGDMPNAGMSRRQILRTDVQKDNAEEHIRRSRDILQKLRTAFSSSSKLTTNPRVVQWKKDLTELEDKAVLPKTIIAVVGDTGAGKSSLMNALLDQLDVLPTSGMRACTAVVVEVMENTTNNKFEADITFLSREEWYKELRLLLKDLTDSEGKIKKGTPDPKSEAGVAFLKIKAVYGRIDTFDVLSRIGLVTRWLDKTRTISSTNPESFRNAINCYIETDDPGAGGQYWPIVKQVRIRLPNCDVCSSGAVLVDLPGVRDSNAARDKIARDYLKKCTVVWVVSSIHRAIDDKTAKDLLGENFRRQLLMDGQYGSIAFICTKADIIKPTEIIRGLKLQKDIQCYEKNLEELTVEQSNLEENINDNKTCLRSMRKEGKQLKKELEELQEVMAEGDVMDLESQEFIELKEEKEKKDQAVKENQENIEKYEKETNEAEKRCLQINIDKSKIRKQLSAFCAMKRNEYSKLQIKKDFKAGLREMKRQADMNTTDFDEEDDDDLYNSDEDDEEIGSSADNLKVFCVSAVEYQKMKNLLTNDGPPAVFSSEDETQIPALQQYVHQLTSVRRKHGVERLLQRLAQYVFDINHYLVEDGTESKSARRHMKNAIKLHSNRLMEKFDPVMQKLMSDLNEAFCGQINPKMYEGVAAANGAANNIVAKWGSKQNKENKSEGGLHLSTYRATIRRQGVFTSPSFGPVNFNEDLSAPMYTCLSIVWDKVFSGILWNHLERCKIILIHTLKSFVDGLCKELLALGVSDTRTSRVTQQIIDSSTHKLSEMISFLKEYVTEQQREINRVLTPTVQENLSQTYENCTMESGKGMFMRIKEKMSQGVDCSRFIMFDEASKRLSTDLEELQKHIISYVRRVCEEICGMLQTSFEPLYEAPENTKLLRKTLLKDIEASSSSMRSLLTEANINLPALALPAATTDTKVTAASASSTSGPLAVPGKGPQAYTTTYKGVQHVVTDTLGFPQNITLEEVKSTYVTDILRSIKEEPGVTSSTIPVSAVHIKKEWNSTDCGQGSVRETIESMDYNQGQYAPLPSSCSSVSKKPFVSDQHCKTSSSNIPLGQSMVSILPNTANLAQSSNSYTSILQPHVTTQPRVTNPSVSRKTGESVIQLTQGSNSVVPSASQIIGNQTNSASTVLDHWAAQYGHPVFMDVPSVAQTVEVTSSNSGPALSAATGLPGLSSSQSRDNSVLRKKIVQNAKNLKVPHSLRSPEKSATTTSSSSSWSPKGSDSPSLKFYRSGRLSLSQKRSGSPIQTSSNVTVKYGNSYEPASKIQRTEKGKVIKITENKPSPKTAAKKKSIKESGGLELEFIVQCRYCGFSSRNLKECDRCGRVFPRNVKVSAIKKK